MFRPNRGVVVDAVVLDRFGGPEALHLQAVTPPAVRPGWTRVHVRAAALNWHDVLVRRGLYKSPLPHIIGADGAGVTDDGDEVVVLPSLFWGPREASPAAGWEILGDTRAGTYAEIVSVPHDCVAPRPAGFSWNESAALTLVGVTAFRALITRARLAQGESALILGAGGGLALMATAIARAVGARPYVTSSSTGKLERARRSGAEDGVLYTVEDWPDLARSMSPGGEGFDVVLDSVGTWSDALTTLRPGGRLVVLGASRAERSTIEARPFYFGQYSLLGTTMGSPGDLRGLLRLVEEGALAPPVIDSTFPLADAAAAHRRLESGEAFGKITLSIS
jgi:NADPH:quinone reductase-like Zn-dependent oxidoreductase